MLGSFTCQKVLVPWIQLLHVFAELLIPLAIVADFVMPSAHLQVAAGQLRVPGDCQAPGPDPAGPGVVQSSCIQWHFLLQMPIAILLRNYENCFNTSFMGR